MFKFIAVFSITLIPSNLPSSIFIKGLILFKLSPGVWTAAGRGCAADYTTERFQDQALSVHNYYRGLYGVPLLTIDKSVRSNHQA